MHVYKSSLIRSLILYSYPLCNLSNYLNTKLSRFEKRDLRIVGDQCKLDVSIFNFGDHACKTLFSTIDARADHPLRELFEVRTGEATIETPSTVRQNRDSNNFLLSFLLGSPNFERNFCVLSPFVMLVPPKD